LGVELDGIGNRDVSASIVADRDRNGAMSAQDSELPLTVDGARLMLAQPVALLPGVDTREPLLRPSPLRYRFFLRVIGGRSRAPVAIAPIQPILRNRITHAIVGCTGACPVPVSGCQTCVHPWSFKPVWPGVTTLAGAVELQSTLEFLSGDELRIEPGTTVRM